MWVKMTSKQIPSWLETAKEQFRKEAQNIFSKEMKKKRKLQILEEKEYVALFTEEQEKAEKTKVHVSQETKISCIRRAVENEKYAKIIKNHLSTTENHDLLTLRNIGNYTQAYFIHISKNTKSSEPIIIDYLLGLKSSTYILLLVNEGIEAEIVEKINVQANNEQAEISVDIIIQKNAKLACTTVQNTSEKTKVFFSRNSFVKRNGKIEIYDNTLGAETSSLTSRVHLQEENAVGNQKGLFFVDKKRKYLISQESYHYAPRTESDIITKAVIQDNAKADFDGLVRIFEEGRGAKGFEKIEILALSENGQVRADPNLEIDTDEVECSHGASISQISEEQLFYLRSRGLSFSQSKKILVEGFFTPQLVASSLQVNEQEEILKEIAKSFED